MKPRSEHQKPKLVVVSLEELLQKASADVEEAHCVDPKGSWGMNSGVEACCFEPGNELFEEMETEENREMRPYEAKIRISKAKADRCFFGEASPEGLRGR